jgi:hypothetical protein
MAKGKYKKHGGVALRHEVKEQKELLNNSEELQAEHSIKIYSFESFDLLFT